MKPLTVFLVLAMVVSAAMVMGCESKDTLAATPTPPQARLEEPDAEGMIAAHAPFTKVEMNGSLDLKLTVTAGEARYKLEGDKQRMGYVDIAIVEGVLIVKERPAHVAVMMGKVTVIVHAPRIEAVTLNGSGNAELRGNFGDALSLVVDGAGNVDVAGEAATLQTTINGSGNIKAGDLQSENASVTINGSGRVELTVTRSLHATITGTGAIVYYGDPASVEKQVMGAGSITAGE